jgi:hypothetical protein
MMTTKEEINGALMLSSHYAQSKNLDSMGVKISMVMIY